VKVELEFTCKTRAYSLRQALLEAQALLYKYFETNDSNYVKRAKRVIDRAILIDQKIEQAELEKEMVLG